MTREEVVRVLGDPVNEHRVDDRTMETTYLPALALLDKFEPGYIGFVINFDNGVVRDWRPLTGQPSYDPEAVGPPREFKWLMIGLAAVFVLLAFLGLLGRFATTVTERERMLLAFTKMEIPLDLPADFKFITRQTTLGEVSDRVGPWSRAVDLPVSEDEVGRYPLITTKHGKTALRIFEYDLPYSGRLVVVPEYPFDESSRVRAVYHWSDSFNPAEETEQVS